MAADIVVRNSRRGRYILRARGRSAPRRFQPRLDLAGDTGNYFATGAPRFDRDYVDVKINYSSDRHAIWGKYGHMSALVGSSGIYGVAGGPAPGSSPGPRRYQDQQRLDRPHVQLHSHAAFWMGSSVLEGPAYQGRLYVVGNWQVNGIFAACTGTPFTVGAPGSALNAPGNSQTADQVGDVRKIGEVGPRTRGTTFPPSGPRP